MLSAEIVLKTVIQRWHRHHKTIQLSHIYSTNLSIMGCTIGTLNLRSQSRQEDEEYGAGSTKNALMQDQQFGLTTPKAHKRQRQLLQVQKSENGDLYSNWQDTPGKRMSKELVIESRDLMCQYIPESTAVVAKDRSYLQSPVKKNSPYVFSEPTPIKRRSNKRKLNRDYNNEFHPSLYNLPRAQMITLADFD